MPTVGSLIVELRANSAQFRAEMDNAGRATRAVGGHAAFSAQQLSRFAAIGVQQLVPSLEGSRVALEQGLQAASRFGGGMANVASTVGPVAAALGGLWIGNFIRNFADARGITESFGERLMVAAGFAEGFKERLQKAVAAQREWNDTLTASVTRLMTLRAELAKTAGQEDAGGLAAAVARRARDAAILKEATGEEITSDSPMMRMLRSVLGPTGWLERAEKEQERNDEARARNAQLASKRRAALALSGQIETEDLRKDLNDRRALRDKADQDDIDKMLKVRDERIKKWQEETQGLIDQLKAQQQARAAALANFGQGGVPGDSTTSGLRSAMDLRAQIEKEARDIALAQRDMGLSDTDAVTAGEDIRKRAIAQADLLRVKFAAFPAVLDAIDRALGTLQFGNFTEELRKARAEIDRTVPTQKMLEEGIGAISAQYAKLPPVTDAAATAQKKLAEEFNNLAWQVYGARQQIAAYERELGGGGAGASAGGGGTSSVVVTGGEAGDNR